MTNISKNLFKFNHKKDGKKSFDNSDINAIYDQTSKDQGS